MAAQLERALHEDSAGEIEAQLQNFDEASPELLAQRGLLRRTDTKFALSLHELVCLIDNMYGAYSLVPANGSVLASYRTLYFDSLGLDCFHDHRRGRRPRHKIRVRHYPDRQVSFLELKCKQSEALTVKYRWERNYGCNDLSSQNLTDLRNAQTGITESITPQLWTNFKRATLVSNSYSERVTIDISLEFKNTTAKHDLGSVAIVEVKQSPFSNQTPIMQYLRNAGCRQISASKYCTAMILLSPSIRHNRFLPSLRILTGEK